MKKSSNIALVVGALGLLIVVFLGSQQSSNSATQSENSVATVENNTSSVTNNSQAQKKDSEAQDTSFVAALEERTTSEVDVYLKKASSFWDVEQYNHAIDMYKQCYQDTGNAKCMQDLANHYFIDSYVELIDIVNEYLEKLDKIAEQKKKEQHPEVSRDWYYMYEPVFPERNPLYKKQYSAKNDDLTNAKCWLETFNTFKMIYNNVYAMYTDFIKTSQNDSDIKSAIDFIDVLEQKVKPNISIAYNKIISSGFVRFTLNGVWDTLAVASEPFFPIFRNKETLRQASKLLGRLDFKLIKTCDENTRNFYAKVIPRFKQDVMDVDEKIWDSAKLSTTLADNVNEGRTGTELWWSE